MATLRFRLSSTLAKPRHTCPPHQPYSWSHLVKRLDLKYDALRCELKWPARSIEGPLGQPLDESLERDGLTQHPDIATKRLQLTECCSTRETEVHP
jgi:hypothetical protein